MKRPRPSPRRRGILFSILALVLAGFIISIFWVMTAPSYERSARTAQARVGVMDDFLRDWEAYVDDATRMAMRESLVAVTNERGFAAPANIRGVVPLEDVVSRANDCFVNGTFWSNFGVPLSNVCYVSPGRRVRTLRAQLGNFTQLAESRMRINMSWAIVSGISVEDYAPFELRVGFTMNYSARDELFATWNRTRQFSIIVPVQGLPDPLWRLHVTGPNIVTTSAADWIIREYPIPRPVLVKGNVSEMILGRYYAAQPGLAPTYLDRLRGALYADPALYDANRNAGIELLVDPLEYDTPTRLIYGGVADERNGSFVDHEMFRMYVSGAYARCGVDTFGVKDFAIANWRLDPVRLARYNFDLARDYDFTCPP